MTECNKGNNDNYCYDCRCIGANVILAFESCARSHNRTSSFRSCFVAMTEFTRCVRALDNKLDLRGKASDERQRGTVINILFLPVFLTGWR